MRAYGYPNAPCSFPAGGAKARRMLNAFADPAGPDAIRKYFTFYRNLKGDAALDRDDILELLRRFEFARAVRTNKTRVSP